MALCELKSEESKVVEPGQIPNEDLEDGEIEDDEEELPQAAAAPPPQTPQTPTAPQILKPPQEPKIELRHEKHDRAKFDRRRHNEPKKKQPMTEAEKSVMFLHQLERMERDKRDKYRREPVDDFASSIEKQIANVLKKDRTVSDEDKEDDKRGKKRKKRDRDRRKKRKQEMFESETVEVPNQHIDVPEHHFNPHHHLNKDNSPRSEESFSDESEGISSDRSGDDRRERRRERHDRRARNRDRNRRNDNREKKMQQQNQQQQYGGQQQQYGQQHYQQQEVQMKDAQQLCVYYLQGKCQKGDECQFSHESQPPMKWELCKFYLNDCCAKGDKCLYMHSDFPCKFYHTGQQCLEGDNCKFAHGKPLSDRLKQILFKHIETAPKDILGRFPRMSRDEAIFKINQTQKGLEAHYGIPPRDGDENIPSLFDISIGMPGNEDGKGKDKCDKTRNRPSRWQDPEPLDGKKMSNFGPKSFHPGQQDLDMRMQNNGDVDMRTLQMSMLPQGPPNLMMPPPNMSIPPPNIIMMNPPPSRPPDQSIDELNFKNDLKLSDVDIRSIRGDTDIRNHNNLESMSSRDVDIRGKDVDARIVEKENLFIKRDVDRREMGEGDDDYEPKLEIVMEDEEKNKDESLLNLPKKQRELYLRIQGQQKQNLLEDQKEDSENEDNNIDWYSDDSNEGKLMIKCDDEKETNEGEEGEGNKPFELVQKLGDLSQITITEEVSKLLSTIRQSTSPSGKEMGKLKEEPIKQSRPDPRKARLGSNEDSTREKISIYEQGSIPQTEEGKDIDLRIDDKDIDLRTNFGDLDLRSSRPDIDLRQLSLPFKAMQNYTPATEIEASISSHPPITWVVHIVEIPKPDYTGLKLSVQEAHSTGDPRLRKIFRLDLEEKDSPASPKQSPKAAAPIRVDPRIRKVDEIKNDPVNMTYAQQMAMLQSSPFYQNLTSNQKVKLNQELSVRDPNTGGNNEQILNGILGTLGLIQSPGNINGAVISLLSTISNMSQLGQNAAMLIGNPNLIQNPNLMQNPNLIQSSNMIQNPNLMQNNLIQNPNLPNLIQNPNMIQNPNLLQNNLMQSNPNMVNPNILNQNQNMGLLGQGPAMQHDFQINFDPRNGGLLGNAPPFANFNQDNQNFNFTEDNFYPENVNMNNNNNNNNRENRGFNRENRGSRRGRNFSRNNRNNNFRNRNRSNRGHNN